MFYHHQNMTVETLNMFCHSLHVSHHENIFKKHHQSIGKVIWTIYYLQITSLFTVPLFFLAPLPFSMQDRMTWNVPKLRRKPNFQSDAKTKRSSYDFPIFSICFHHVPYCSTIFSLIFPYVPHVFSIFAMAPQVAFEKARQQGVWQLLRGAAGADRQLLAEIARLASGGAPRRWNWSCYSLVI